VSEKRVAIIGAGPAGLIAADRLSRAGATVDVYDRMPSPARKLLMAGRGGLNLTHSEPFDRFITRYGTAAEHLRPALEAFPPEALRAFAAELGEETFIGTSGRVFPRAMKASPLLRAWLARLDAQGVRLHMRHTWTGWTRDGALAFDTPAGPLTVHADAVLLGLGGGSWPRLGSDGGWVPLLRANGLAVTDLEPANAGVRINWSDIFRERHAGTPLKRIALTCAGRTVRGEAMVTQSGLEGGAVYALGAGIRQALAEGPVTLALDLRPDLTTSTLAERLARAPKKLSFANLMRKAAGLSPVAAALVREATGPARPEGAELAAVIKALPLAVTGMAGLERAISSAGGLSWDEIGADYGLARLPGTFACGEMLDWEAPTGGYLLQACFATGWAAAGGILASLGLPLSR